MTADRPWDTPPKAQNETRDRISLVDKQTQDAFRALFNRVATPFEQSINFAYHGSRDMYKVSHMFLGIISGTATMYAQGLPHLVHLGVMFGGFGGMIGSIAAVAFLSRAHGERAYSTKNQILAAWALTAAIGIGAGMGSVPTMLALIADKEGPEVAAVHAARVEQARRP